MSFIQSKSLSGMRINGCSNCHEFSCFRNKATWLALLNNTVSDPPVPTVSFTEHTVVAVQLLAAAAAGAAAVAPLPSTAGASPLTAGLASSEVPFTAVVLTFEELSTNSDSTSRNFFQDCCGIVIAVRKCGRTWILNK